MKWSSNCIEVEKCQRPFDVKRSHYCNYAAPGRDNYTVNCVNWNMTKAHCGWPRGGLAYEAEWEKAARAGTSTPHFLGHQAASRKVAVIDPDCRAKQTPQQTVVIRI
jgi:formylglycine-generating enzyme required for sulfatase activity